VVCCWGADGAYRGRDRQILELLRGIPLHALALTKMGHPRHPLYLKGSCRPIPFAGSLAMRCAAVMAGTIGKQRVGATRSRAVSSRTQSRGRVLALAERFRQKAIGADEALEAPGVVDNRLRRAG
jgi:Protein of unknown function (DUF1643)